MKAPTESERKFTHSAVAIIPASDLDASQAFYEKLGFAATSIYHAHGYRILHDARGASIHLTRVEPGWVEPARNAHGIYFYSEDVEALAARVGGRVRTMPWGLREFAVSDPDGTLVRVGWAS
jgi:catechol 2,3-dioxygenase-like lactoylglutathione lyase family enzyme